MSMYSPLGFPNATTVPRPIKELWTRAPECKPKERSLVAPSLSPSCFPPCQTRHNRKVSGTGPKIPFFEYQQFYVQYVYQLMYSPLESWALCPFERFSLNVTLCASGVVDEVYSFDV